MGASESDILSAMHGSLRELDEALGSRTSAMVISGRITPPRRGVKTQESPQYLTSRAMVTPMLQALGYNDVTMIRREMETVPGLAIAVTATNHPLIEASENLLRTMRFENIEMGMATDGIRWVLAETYGGRPKIVGMSDLRPYYLEILDRDRFRTAIPEDRRNLRLFSNLFSKSESPRGLSTGRTVWRTDGDVVDNG